MAGARVRDHGRMAAEFPADGMELTHLLVVSDLSRSVPFYRDVLGATVFREYGGTSCVLQFLGTRLLLGTGGDPPPDKPTVRFAPPAHPDRGSAQRTLPGPASRGAA